MASAAGVKKKTKDLLTISLEHHPEMKLTLVKKLTGPTGLLPGWDTIKLLTIGMDGELQGGSWR